MQIDKFLFGGFLCVPAPGTRFVQTPFPYVHDGRQLRIYTGGRTAWLDEDKIFDMVDWCFKLGKMPAKLILDVTGVVDVEFEEERRESQTADLG